MEGDLDIAGGRRMHARSLFIGVVGVVTALVLNSAAPALADGGGDAWTGDNEIGAEAGTGGSAGRGAGAGSGRPRCTYTLLGADTSDTADHMAEVGIGPPRGEEPGAWYRKICDNGDGTTTGSIVWISDRVDPEVLAVQAEDRVPIPAPGIRMNPAPRSGSVVNVPTWLWIDGGQWAPVNAQASAGGVTVTATAAPQSVTWDMGNGDTVVCTGPGTAYDPAVPAEQQTTDCSYTYRRSSAGLANEAYIVTATVRWDVTWTIVGAPGGGSLGSTPRSEAISVRVAEVQALNQ